MRQKVPNCVPSQQALQKWMAYTYENENVFKCACNDVNTSRFSPRSSGVWITRISARTRSSEAVPTSEVSFLPTISEKHKIYLVSIYF